MRINVTKQNGYDTQNAALDFRTHANTRSRVERFGESTRQGNLPAEIFIKAIA